MNRKEQENFNDIMGALLNKEKQSRKPIYQNKKAEQAVIQDNKTVEPSKPEPLRETVQKEVKLEFEEVTVPTEVVTMYEAEKIMESTNITQDVKDIMQSEKADIQRQEDKTKGEKEKMRVDVKDTKVDNKKPEAHVMNKSQQQAQQTQMATPVQLNKQHGEVKQQIKMPSTPAAIIPAGAIIKGNLEFNTDLSISGQIEGDIKCDKSIYIMSGANIKGNLEAISIFVENSTVTGDLNIKEKGEILGDSSINGNITAKQLLVDTSIKGNITVDDSLEIRQNGNIIGDIKAKLMSTVKGSVICGVVEVGYSEK